MVAAAEHPDARREILLRTLSSRVQGDSAGLLRCFSEELRATLDAEEDVGSLQAAVSHLDTLQDAAGDGLLHLSAAAGHVTSVRFLCVNHARVNQKNLIGDTPMFGAVKALLEGVDSLQLLVEHGADPSAQNVRGDTPLHVAAYFGQTERVAYLLRAGAQFGACNLDGETPAHRAAKAGEAQMLSLLSTAGADLCATDSVNSTPAHHAAHKARIEALKELLKLDSRCLRWPNSKGNLPLHLAAAGRQGQSAVEVILAHGGDIGLDVENLLGETPLQVAQKNGHQGSAQLLAAALAAQASEL